ncbi:hypothetical protein H6G76_30885 [Nostoc sp. FACHB-152]|uniref:hypothetical protein n=1 Tax=unclassified Nostoc TaxID=2593658 RepID=UPI001685C3BD|nr:MULTISPECIES: hypothetical protein [unclassified Nostoc]MBD2451451.1 hypothetical protein [Nostoc sp. FACHB-152]MBD2469987.1 hypothetical protein [Nostoc sp. FACHB-145]
MFIRLFYLLVSTFSLAISLSSIAIAETAQSGCTFSQFLPGYLATDKILPTKLASLPNTGGTAIEVTVTCNQPSKLMVLPPRQTSGINFTPVSAVATVETPTGLSINSNQASSLPLSVGTTSLIINIFVDKGSPLAAGNYAFAAELTIIP